MFADHFAISLPKRNFANVSRLIHKNLYAKYRTCLWSKLVTVTGRVLTYSWVIGYTTLVQIFKFSVLWIMYRQPQNLVLETAYNYSQEYSDFSKYNHKMPNLLHPQNLCVSKVLISGPDFPLTFVWLFCGCKGLYLYVCIYELHALAK